MKELYALREIKTGYFLTIEARSNGDDEFSNECTIQLESQPATKTPWVTTDDRHANYVRCISTGWYNSTVEFPTHRYKPEELEIVDLITGSVLKVKDLPTTKELMAVVNPELPVKDTEGRDYFFDDYLKYFEITLIKECFDEWLEEHKKYCTEG